MLSFQEGDYWQAKTSVEPTEIAIRSSDREGNVPGGAWNLAASIRYARPQTGTRVGCKAARESEPEGEAPLILTLV